MRRDAQGQLAGGRDEQHRRRVVQATLGLEDGAHPAGQRHASQDGEDGGRVGGGRDGAQQQGHREAQIEDVEAEQGHQANADADAHRRQKTGHTQRRADVRPLRGEATLGQDEHQRGEAETVRE